MSDSFTYRTFELSADRKTVALSYSLEHGGSHTLTETFTFAIPLSDTYETARLLRALHLACGISYYKMFMPPVIAHPYEMGESEAFFWNEVFRGGLGEFLYVNKLDPARLAAFSAQEGLVTEQSERTSFIAGAVLGIGGGKDSILAGEALKKAGVPLEGFVMATGEALGQAGEVAKVMGVPLHVIGRQLDKQLLELQEQPGAYKGHIPISLIFGLVGSLLAAAKGISYAVVANERSASTPQTEWQGQAVNHQWSKSSAFEAAFQNYLHAHVSENLTYFSAIRPLGSVGVAKAFAKLPQYFEVFTSDNFVFRMDPAKRPNSRWSLESPKSLSSFILLSPWLDEDAMRRIFGINFFEKTELKDLFLSLVGIKGNPPLDCVGTPPELAASLAKTLEQGKWQGSPLLDLPEMIDLSAEPLEQFTAMSDDQHFPAPLLAPLTEVLKEFSA
jgi:hypothetical protein